MNKKKELLKLFTPYVDDEWHGEGYPIKAHLMADDVLDLLSKEEERIKAEERERVFEEVEKMLGIPSTDKPFSMNVQIYSGLWKSLRKGGKR